MTFRYPLSMTVFCASATDIAEALTFEGAETVAGVTTVVATCLAGVEAGAGVLGFETAKINIAAAIHPTPRNKFLRSIEIYPFG